MQETERLSKALKGQYEIEREIGQGGMAVVYLARDLKHDRKVALKVLRQELTSVMGVDRFPREIHIIAQMQHPHILALHDSGEVDGFLYYVMPFVDGETLRQRIARQGPLSVHEGVRLLQEITDALAYAHNRGVMHRDIKPDNVMLSGKHATVTDFGIAKAVRASTKDKLTTVGIAVGTPQYMAPEQATADTNVDHRADIYALGVLGYEMLTGRGVFEGATSQAILAAHVLEPPKDIRERRPEVPPQLAEALLKCLAKDPADRWQSADELLAQLETVATTPSGGVTPTNTRPFKATEARSPKPEDRRGAGRRGVWVGVAAGVALAVVVGAVFALRGGSGKIEKIGVMPIQDISGKDSILVNAMHVGLTTALSQLNLAAVANHNDMMQYLKTPKTTREIAKENGLNAVVEATVFRAGDVIRINVQFTDPVTSRSLWADTFDRNAKDVLAAESEVVGRIASGVKGALTAQAK